jgi:thiamine biosynthesis lipoprotein
VAVEHPDTDEPIAMVGVGDGAVATSTTLRRRWQVEGVERHHLIDPATGEPSTSDLVLATVVAGEAWAAEVLAKAVLLRGSAHPFDLLGGTGAEAIAVTRDGVQMTSDGFAAFTTPRVAS